MSPRLVSVPVAIVTAVVGLFGLVSAASADVLYDNGSIITSPTGGFGGAPLSRSNSNVLTAWAGMDSFRLGDGRDAKVADDFVVSTGGWAITSVTGFGGIQDSQYSNPPVTSPITSCLFEIWSGTPDDSGGVVVASSTAILSNVWSGVYRTRSTDPAGNTLPVWAVTADFGGLVLAPGSYWVSFNFTGLSPQGADLGTTPFVMSVNGTVRTTVNGNGRNWNNGDGFGWRQTIVGNQTAQGVEYPFILNGTAIPAPSAALLLGLPSLLLRRRRNA